jgi:hypothetical protein
MVPGEGDCHPTDYETGPGKYQAERAESVTNSSSWIS